MNQDTIQRLVALNTQFYQTFAVQFGQTRRRLQPGVRRWLDAGGAGGGESAALLDLGCGSGELLRELARRGWPGEYCGLDFSAGLLEQVRTELPESAGLRLSLLQADLVQEDWSQALPRRRYPAVSAFAVLHHIPGQAARLELLRRVRACLEPGGRFILSNWQFLNSPRLAARIQPWPAAGFQPGELEPGDYLLDWRSGGSGLRYVHHFSASELESLAAACGLQVLEQYASDGEGGNLGLYQIWGG